MGTISRNEDFENIDREMISKLFEVEKIKEIIGTILSLIRHDTRASLNA